MKGVVYIDTMHLSLKYLKADLFTDWYRYAANVDHLRINSDTGTGLWVVTVQRHREFESGQSKTAACQFEYYGWGVIAGLGDKLAAGAAAQGDIASQMIALAEMLKNSAPLSGTK